MVWGWVIQRLQQEEPCGAKLKKQSIFKKITIWSLYKRSNGTWKKRQSQGSIYIQRTIRHILDFTSSAVSVLLFLPLSFRGNFMVLLQSVHRPPFNACTSIYTYVCVHGVCVCSDHIVRWPRSSAYCILIKHVKQKRKHRQGFLCDASVPSASHANKKWKKRWNTSRKLKKLNDEGKCRNMLQHTQNSTWNSYKTKRANTPGLSYVFVLFKARDAAEVTYL